MLICISLILFQGSPQWIEVNFQRTVSIAEIHIMFQGGFTGRECYAEVLRKDQSEFEKILDFFPEDINSSQVVYKKILSRIVIYEFPLLEIQN